MERRNQRDAVSADPAKPSLTAEKNARELLVVSLWTGLFIGLVEGAGWLVFQHFGRLTQLWTQVLWIAPILDALVFGVVGLILVALGRVLPRRWWWPLSLFVVAGAAAFNLVSLTLGTYVYRWGLFAMTLGIASAAIRIFRRHENSALAAARRTLPVLAGAVVLLFVGVQGFYLMEERSLLNRLPEARPGAPDVLVVVIDALRADHVSAYGYERPTSPFIDELARQGVLFERAISTSSYSLPSHASMLSGLFTYQHGVEWLDFKVFRDAQYPSIAEAMYDRGYKTGAFSANPFWFTREQGFGRGFIRFEDYYYHSLADMAYRTVFGNNFTTVKLLLGFDDVPARKWAPESTDRVLDWVLRDDRPFFAFVNYFDVHAPYTPPQPFRNRFSTEQAPGGILNWLMDRRGDVQLTPKERQSEIDGYDGAIAFVDTEVRRLVETIRSARTKRDLLVILTSDHGEAFGEHGGYLHARSLYREELHIPLIVQGPNVPAGLRIARPVTHAAVPATVLDLVSDGAASTFGSQSLARLWKDPSAPESWPYPVAEAGQREWAHESFPMHHGNMRSVLSPEWHFIAHEVLPDELYSWDDSKETKDRAKDPAMQEVIRTFKALLSEATSVQMREDTKSVTRYSAVAPRDFLAWLAQRPRLK